MVSSQRLRIVLGGSALVTVTGVATAWMRLPGLFGEHLSFHALVAAFVVLAPLFLIPAGVASLATGSALAWGVVAGAVATILAFPIYPILRLPRFQLVGALGLLAWIACQIYVAFAAGAL